MSEPATAAVKLFETSLGIAKEALEEKKINEVYNRLKGCLEIKINKPDQDSKIRQLIKTYSDQFSQETPPNWEIAEETLNLLPQLNLQTPDTETWWRELKLRQLKDSLDENEFDQAIEILAKLIGGIKSDPQGQEHVDQKAPEVIRQYIMAYASQSRWTEAEELAKEAKALWEADSWARNEKRVFWLETIAYLCQTAAKTKRQTMRFAVLVLIVIVVGVGGVTLISLI
jgi:tetratricopeptide (TPR) repeat protein